MSITAATGTDPLAATRVEHDLLGDRRVPAQAYYGVHTLRAIENFPITGTPISTYPDLVVALACVKQAAAGANAELGMLPRDVAEAIAAACTEIRAGAHAEEFVVDVIQGGAGTSTNMNANEVIANRALEIVGRPRGDYASIHPIEHVNLSQSTNDVYPTAVKIALLFAVAPLVQAMDQLAQTFTAKAAEYAGVMKMGRTQLQDAVPMTVGQEFATYAGMLRDGIARLREASTHLTTISLGGTAIGTGINTAPRYAETSCAHLRNITGLDLTTATDLVEATQDVGAFVQLSAALKHSALRLSKVCNDLRLLSSGPQAGLSEVNLPAVQAGSSIMPGKVNPVVPEVVNQVAFEVIGNDVAITLAAEGGQLQLNAFEPVIAHSLFKSIRHMTNACRTLDDKCVTGITVNIDHLRAVVQRSVGIATALNPHIGYSAATEIAALALETGRSVIDLVIERGLLSRARVAEVLQPENLIPSLRSTCIDDDRELAS